MLISYKLVSRTSKINGTGIFTAEPVKRGTDFYKIPEDKILDHNHHQAARIGGNKFVWDEEVLNYVNHSCNPNTTINLTNLTLVALRDIKADEEITCDYDFTEGDFGYHFICNCKDKNCRMQLGSTVRRSE